MTSQSSGEAATLGKPRLPGAGDGADQDLTVERDHEEIAACGWTQQCAADVLGIDEPRVSPLVCGKTGQVSLERRIKLLEQLSYDVRIETTQLPTRSC